MNAYGDRSSVPVIHSNEGSDFNNMSLPHLERVMPSVAYPQVGDVIYVPSSTFGYRGSDDFQGGQAKICRVKANNNLPLSDVNYWMVEIEGRPGVLSNWKILIEQQDELRRRFGEQTAHPDPDYRAEFNQPNADWK